MIDHALIGASRGTLRYIVSRMRASASRKTNCIFVAEDTLRGEVRVLWMGTASCNQTASLFILVSYMSYKCANVDMSVQMLFLER